MDLTQERIDELIKEGFASGDREIKEINLENGKKYGIIKVLKKILVETLENLYGEIDSLVSKKIDFIQDRHLLRALIINAHDKIDINTIYKSINNYLADEDMYKKLGYRKAISKAESYYADGRYNGYHSEKLSVTYDIFEKRFGELELEIEAIIKTKNLEDRIDDLYNMTYQIYNKQELIRYLNDKMTLANRMAAGGFIFGYKSVLLKNLIKNKFLQADCFIEEKIDKLKYIKHIELVTEELNNTDSIEEFTKKLTFIVDQSLNKEWDFEDIDFVHLEHLLEE